MTEALSVLQTRYNDQSDELNAAKELENVLRKAQALLKKRFEGQTIELHQALADEGRYPMKPNRTIDHGEVRRRAEEQLKSRQAADAPIPSHEMQRLLQELKIHQIELEMQNEELQRPTRNWKYPRSAISTCTIWRRCAMRH